MADQSRQVTRVKLHHFDQPSIFPAPYSTVRQAGKYLTAGAIGTVLLALSGLTLTGTVVALIMATPVLVLFSPVLVPAGIVLLLMAAGLVFSGGCGVAAVTLLTWMYKVVSNYLAAAKKRGNAIGQFILV